MTAIVLRDPKLVDRRLRQEFGVDTECLVEIVRAAVAARAQSTDDSPRSAGAYYAWSAATTRMRQLFRPQGWYKNDANGIETVVDHEGRIKIAILSTDRGTADEERTPRNRTEKGSASERLVNLNSQYELFKDSEMGHLRELKCTLWYLCIFDDGSKVRAELSRPVDFLDGFVSAFRERIFILRDGDWERVSLAPPDDDAPRYDELDIVVRRR